MLVGATTGSVLAFTVAAPRSTAGAASGGPPAMTWAAQRQRAPDFRLIDQLGRPVSLSADRGRPVIVTFIDPLCRNFCPFEAQQLNDLVDSLPSNSRPAVIAVSVDVYGNARANLLQDVRKWRLVPQWRWAIGSPGQLARVWQRYRIGVLVTTKKIAGVRVHEISHTEAAYVVDGDGYERALFLWPFRASDVLGVLRRLTPTSS